MSSGCSHAEVDAVLYGGENSEKDTDDEDCTVDWCDPEEVERHFVGGNQVADSMDDDGTQGGLGDVVEGRGEAVDGQKHTCASEHTGKGRLDTALGLEGSSREGSCCWVRVEERSHQVGHSDGDELLIWVDLVVVDAAEGLCDRDVLQDEHNGCNREVGSKICRQSGRWVEHFNILETRVDLADDTEWCFFRGWPVADHQVRDERGKDDHNGCSDMLQVEVELVLRVSPVEPSCEVPPCVKNEETHQAERCVHLGPVQVLQSVDHHLVGGLPSVDVLVEAHEPWNLANNDAEGRSSHEGQHCWQGDEFNDESKPENADCKRDCTTEKCQSGCNFRACVLITVLALHPCNDLSHLHTHDCNRADGNILTGCKNRIHEEADE